MFAVIKAGGKQHRVAANDIIEIEKINAKDGETINFDEVLAIGMDEDFHIGSPFVDGACVKAEVVKQMRSKKVIIFKKRRRQNSKRTRGHRQHMTVVRVTDIIPS
ncbi:LSU ribosomal protein L21p [Liberibacter crescens BT-1]|uniref:Large ribosomal subunit protein bL21 n=1 Tax=Liberibacter crescens (strain BT-1) TaxID=1215343 RepID=L0EW60_LIBCB|nr:50S ribosomal protein L21 [Liberibacter crescens]AGA65197.1 LSU ribosomal protein L21p [Liberibacter crescens BT-1]AMC13151.1 50S ribosomal protein L21 [Liberibacter crescens]